MRAGGAQPFSEFIATFGLLAVIWGVVRRRSAAVPFAVGAYITAADWLVPALPAAAKEVVLPHAQGREEVA